MSDAETQEVESVADSIRAAMQEIEAVGPEEAPAEEPVEEPEEAEEASEPEDAPELPLKAREEPDETEETAEEPEEEAEEEPEEVVFAPADWSKEDREAFSKLAEVEGDAGKLAKEVQGIIAKREAERRSGTDRAIGELAPMKAVTEKYGDYFRQIGVTPDQAFGNLMETERSLRFGTPAQKFEALEGIARMYGIPLQAQQQQNGQDQQDAYVDPDVAALREEFGGQLGEIRNLLSSRQQAEALAEERSSQSLAATFFEGLNGADPAESPEIRYVQDVMPRFMSMVEEDRKANGTPDVGRLRQLYTDAAWSEPGVRAKMQEDIAQRQKAREKTVKRTVVKKSSSPAGGTGASARSEEPDLNESVRDTVARSMRDLARQSGAL